MKYKTISETLKETDHKLWEEKENNSEQMKLF